jgi:phenylpyruvate tautomerase PptA (4-oxalocrotonate tautomerase family)
MEITENLKALYRLKKAELTLEKEGVLGKLSSKDRSTISVAIEDIKKEKKVDELAKDKR